jgi:hypothetical protein
LTSQTSRMSSPLNIDIDTALPWTSTIHLLPWTYIPDTPIYVPETIANMTSEPFEAVETTEVVDYEQNVIVSSIQK